MEWVTLLYRLVPFAVVLVLGGYLFWLLREHQLTVKYASIWIAMLLALLVFAIFPAVADWMARSLGFELTSNFLFAVAIFVLLIAVLQLSMQLVATQKQVRDLARAQALATLEHNSPEVKPHTENTDETDENGTE